MAGLWCMLLVACGGTAQGPVSSTPTAPTAELEPEPAPEVTWSGLVGLVPRGEVAFPESLQGLSLGMPGAEARAVLDRARDPDLPLHAETRAPFRVVGAGLAGFPEVGATLIMDADTEVLLEVDLSLPADQALFVLTESWGEPTSVDMKDLAGAGSVAVWSSAELAVTLYPAEKGASAVVKYRTVP